MAKSVWVVATCLIVSLLFLTPSGAQQAPARARAGILVPAGTAELLHQPLSQSSALAVPVQSRPKGGRLLHPKGSTPAIASPVSQAVVSAPALVDESHGGHLLSNFNGVSSLDSAVTNFGAEFEPPDQGLCVGNGFVVEPVNSAFTVYRRDGSVVVGPLNVNVLFQEGLTEFTSDPRCFYDVSTHTWFATIVFISADNSNARTDIAVNPSGDPTTPWTVYHLDNTDDGTRGTPAHPNCPCFGDQPLFGIDRHNIYVSTNEFQIVPPFAFNGPQIYAISKSDLVSLAGAVHFVHFENLTIAGQPGFSVQPAITYDGDGAEYFLSSLDLTGTDNRLGVWAITDPDAVREGGIPTLSNLVITSETYGVPPNAIQKGSTSQLNTGDDRMQQVQFIQGNLWGALSTAFTFPGQTIQRSEIAWFKVQPRVDDGRISSAELRSQGFVTSPGNDVFYPAIQASPNGAVAMVMSISGPNLYGSAAYTLLSEDHTSFGPIRMAAKGAGVYDPAATRWGDYSAAVVDPDGDSIWLATEYVPPLASQTTDGLKNWGTRVLEVSTRGQD